MVGGKGKVRRRGVQQKRQVGKEEGNEGGMKEGSRNT